MSVIVYSIQVVILFIIADTPFFLFALGLLVFADLLFHPKNLTKLVNILYWVVLILSLIITVVLAITLLVFHEMRVWFDEALHLNWTLVAAIASLQIFWFQQMRQKRILVIILCSLALWRLLLLKAPPLLVHIGP